MRVLWSLAWKEALPRGMRHGSLKSRVMGSMTRSTKGRRAVSNPQGSHRLKPLRHRGKVAQEEKPFRVRALL